MLMFACSFFGAKPSPPQASIPLPTVATSTPEATPTPIPHHHRRRHKKSHAVTPSMPGATPAPTSSAATTPGASQSANPMASATAAPAASGTASSNLPSPAAIATPGGPAHVSIGGENTDPASVRALLDQAETNLRQAKRSSLTGDDAAAFDQSSNLLAAAYRALNQGDYLAASGLAQKAKVLSDRFAANPSP